MVKSGLRRTGSRDSTPGLLAGYLGAGYDPFVLGADPSAPDFRVDAAGLPDDVTNRRFDDRQTLLQKLDSEQRRLDKSGQVETLGTISQKVAQQLADAAAACPTEAA